MSKSDALFLLIKSLSSGEKALVRQAEKGQPGYLALFDLLSRQQVHDERKAKKRLQQQGVDINFAYAKNYLTKHILRVLRESEDAGPWSGNRMVQEIDILMRRKIFDLAEKMLQKAKERTLAEERWQDFLQLSGIEMSLLLQNGGDMAETLRQIDSLNAERQHARKMLVNLGEFEDLYYSYRPVVKHKQNARNEWDLASVQQFGAQPLLASPSNALSNRAKRMYLLCQSMIHAFTGDFERAATELAASVELYRSVAYLMDDHTEGFLNDLWRLGGMKLHFGEFPAVEAILMEIKEFKEARGLHESDIFEKYHRLLLGYALQSRNYQLVNAQLAAIEEGLVVHQDSIPWTSQSMLLLWIARLLFEQGKYKDAKVWINRILDHPDRGQREDIQGLARIMLIFIYFETAEADLCESQSKATRKFLQRRASLHQFERRILRFLEQHSFSEKGKSLATALRELRADLETIFQNALEANVLAYFDILAWLDAKIAKMG